MLEQLLAIIAREEAFLPKFAPGTPQHSLLVNRIAALHTVQQLLTHERIPSHAELETALRCIASILQKTQTACSRHQPDSLEAMRLQPLIALMERSQRLLLKALSQTERTWLDEVTAKVRRKNQLLFTRDSLILQPLSGLIAASSRRTLTFWALELAEQAVADFERSHPGESRPGSTVRMARAWAAGEVKMPIAKRAILDCHALAKEMFDPADAARCHAIAQGCSVVHTAGHALGLPIYELTAIVLERGLNDCQEAVEQRNQSYIDTLRYWQQREPEFTGPWADFL